jgi:hypothetical protein
LPEVIEKLPIFRVEKTGIRLEWHFLEEGQTKIINDFKGFFMKTSFAKNPFKNSELPRFRKCHSGQTDILF